MVEPAAAKDTANNELESVPGESTLTICPGDPEFLQLVLDYSGEDILTCYQCHKCASGCPVASQTDYTPDKLIRLIQLGERDRALGAEHLHTCVSCYTCGTRCPNDINGARVIEALKHIASEQNVPPAKPKVKAFHDTFLMSIRHWGRVNEAELMGVYSLKTGFDWNTIFKSPTMFFKGRLHLWGGRIKGLKGVRKLFEKSGKEYLRFKI